MTGKEKILGMFLGIGIGDALGQPVETKDAAYIAKNHGRLTRYLFDSTVTTDDTQLSLSVARALIRTGNFDMDVMAEEHADAFMQNISGWGGSTREAIGRIVDGCHWGKSGITDKPNRGTGNGICMKVAPVGAYMWATNPTCNNPEWTNVLNNLARLAMMTHRSNMAIASGVVQACGVFKCLNTQPDQFNVDQFIKCVISSTKITKNFPQSPADAGYDMEKLLSALQNHAEYDQKKIIDEFGGGSCFVCHSLPFTYMWFVKNPNSVESMYDCVNAGGDTDTNASMLGALLGALHGPEIFPTELVDGLNNKDELVEIADQFCEKFSIN